MARGSYDPYFIDAAFLLLGAWDTQQGNGLKWCSATTKNETNANTHSSQKLTKAKFLTLLKTCLSIMHGF